MSTPGWNGLIIASCIIGFLLMTYGWETVRWMIR